MNEFGKRIENETHENDVRCEKKRKKNERRAKTSAVVLAAIPLKSIKLTVHAMLHARNENAHSHSARP